MADSDPWHALRTPEGRDLVARLTPWDESVALTTLAAARRDPAWADRPEVVAAAATQARLRTRAAARFPGPARWWTADGLEQASRPEVGRRQPASRVGRAARIPPVRCGAVSGAASRPGRDLRGGET